MSRNESPELAALRKFALACGGQKAASVKFGCSPQFVNQVLSGKKSMPESMLSKLGLRRREIVEAK